MRILAAIIGLLIFGCTSDDLGTNSFRDDASILTLNGTWRVISFENHVDNSVELKNQENSFGLEVHITFDDTNNPKEISGTNTTNTFLGEFEYLGARKFKIVRYGATKVGQPVWGDKFNEAILEGEVTFKINRGALRIYYNNGMRSVTLVKE